jgi:dienelactone hydrolase
MGAQLKRMALWRTSIVEAVKMSMSISRPCYIAVIPCVLALALATRADAQDLKERVLANHRMYIPEVGERHPVVIALPGCSGVSLESPVTDEGGGSPTDPLFRRHYPRMAERLRSQGFAVMLVNYLTAEGVINACSGEISPQRIGEYLGASLDWLGRESEIDPAPLHVIAWSLGGSGLLAYLEQLGEKESNLISGVALYPGCAGAEPWGGAHRFLMLLGDSDDITSPEACQRLIEGVRHRELVILRRYPNARHGFDVEEAPPLIETPRGTTVGYDPVAALAAWSEIVRFLADH